MKTILEVTSKFSSGKLKDAECLAYLIKVATANAQRLAVSVLVEHTSMPKVP